MPGVTGAANFVTIDNVGLTYLGSDGVEKTAVSSVTTSIAQNQFVSIIGPSGCGKTTLLKVLGDLLAPSKGTVRIAGRPPSELRKQQQIGYMFQSSVLLPWLSIGDNIELLAKLAKKRLEVGAVEQLAELVGIQGTADKYPHELSGGMQQRASIARALALDPTLLLMDEPFGALDEITRRRMNLELLDIWHQRRKTAIFITHSIEEAVFLSDRVLVMAASPGRVVEDVAVPLPRPRTTEMRYSPEMVGLVEDLYGALESSKGGVPNGASTS